MPQFPRTFYSDQANHAPLKLSTFAKIRELKMATDQLLQIGSKPPTQRKAWLKDHGQQLREMIDQYTDFFSLDVEQADLDQEMIGLLTEYNTRLKEVIAVAETIYTA